MTATRNPRLLSVQPVSDGGGSEQALIGMIRQLTADGWECHVALPGPARLASEYASAGAILHPVDLPRLTTSGGAARWIRYVATWPLAVARLARLARRLDVSIVHSNSLHAWHGWAAAAISGRAHVWHAREIVFQSGPALALERFLARHFANRVIAVSSAVAAQLHPANVVVISDEADPVLFAPARAGRFRTGVGIDDQVPLVGSVARLDTWKGFDVLLDAWPAVRCSCPAAELVIAGPAVHGKEGYAAHLQRRAADLPGVHWLGRRADIAELMADLDVFVQVSTEPEPFGLVVVEALTSGTPVVAGAEGGPLEILGRDAVGSPVPQGRLVPAGDASALAAAVVQLLPRATSENQRRARKRLRDPSGRPFTAVFEEAASIPRGFMRTRLRRGRARSDRPRPGSH